MMGEVFLVAEVLKSAVVSIDSEWYTKEINMPFLKSMDNGEEFLFMHRVVEFGTSEGSRFESNRVS